MISYLQVAVGSFGIPAVNRGPITILGEVHVFWKYIHLHLHRSHWCLNFWSSAEPSYASSGFHGRLWIERLEAALLLTPMWNIVHWWLPRLFPEGNYWQHELHTAESHLHLCEKYATLLGRQICPDFPTSTARVKMIPWSALSLSGAAIKQASLNAW